MDFDNLTTIIGGLLASKLCDMLTTGALPLNPPYPNPVSRQTVPQNLLLNEIMRGPLVPSSTGLLNPTIRVTPPLTAVPVGPSLLSCAAPSLGTDPLLCHSVSH